MPTERDFDVLYQETPIHVRANANLPGRFIYHINTLEFIREELDRSRNLIENDASLGAYDANHQHAAGCNQPCNYWSWRDYGLPDTDHNPLRNYSDTYLQLSRAEAMKGSEQVVRGFSPNIQGMVEGVGNEPDLMPKYRKDGTTVVIQNGAQEARKVRRGFGLGR